MSLQDQYKLGEPGVFRERCLASAIGVAIAVQGESQAAMTTVQWQKRAVLADGVLAHPNTHERRIALAVAADGVTDNASTDAAIDARVTALWDDLAGVTGEDLV